MTDTMTQLALSIINSSVSKQFNLLLKILVFILTIVMTTALYFHFFEKLELNFEFKMIVSTLFSPLTIVWVLFFVFLYFGVYPVIAKGNVIIYRIINPPTGNVKKHLTKSAAKGFRLTGIDIKLKQLPPEKLEEVYTEVSFSLIEAEAIAVEQYTYLLIILIHCCIFFKTFLNGKMSLLIAFSLASLIFISYIYFLLPKIYKLLRNLLLSEYKRLIKENATNKPSSTS